MEATSDVSQTLGKFEKKVVLQLWLESFCQYSVAVKVSIALCSWAKNFETLSIG